MNETGNCDFNKSIITSIVLGLSIFAAAVTAQQIIPIVTTTTHVTVPPVTWNGASAQVIAEQLLRITNADGSLIVPDSLFGAGNNSTITLSE